jgi:hypothetical protein
MRVYVAVSVIHEDPCGRGSGSWGTTWMWSNQWFARIYVAQSVVHESLCSRVSGSLGFVWLSQWFARIHVAAAVVHGRLFGRVSGSRGSMWSSQWFMRYYVAKSLVHEDIWCRVFSGSWGSMWSREWFVFMRIYGAEYSMVPEIICGRESGSCSWGSMVPSIQWLVRVYVGESGVHEGLPVCGRFNGSWGSVSESVDLLIVPADC